MSRMRQQQKRQERLMQKIDKAEEIYMYHLTPSQLNAKIDKHIDGTHMADKLVMALTLHNEFGFGKERIERALKRFKLQYECIAKNTLTSNDILTWCKEKGIDIDA